MHPIFAIIANKQNITDLIKDRLLSLQITDQAGIKSDMLTITLDDREHQINLPNHGAELECYIGYDHAPLDYMGLYIVDEVELNAPPAQITIRAHAADMRASLKSSRDTVYDNITLSDLTKIIANRHGLSAKIGVDITGIAYDHINQIKESDINLLTRLAVDHDALISVKASHLILTPKAQGKTISGQTLSTITVKQNDISNWRVTIADRALYQSVSASYYDSEEASNIIITTGEGEPKYAIKKSYKNADEATKAAEAKYKEFKRGTRTLTLTLPYQSSLCAERPIAINDIREGINGEWIIEEARHELTSQGLITNITATLKE